MISNFNLNISSDDLIKILTVLFTAISTYIVAKYNSNTPRKLEIKQKQLTNVYLPIYKLIRYDMDKDINKATALKYSIKIKSILLKNYELAFPQLHLLNDKFLEAIKYNSDYQIIFKKICYQINLDYNLLKRSLGYPSDTTWSIFARMNLKDKLKNLIGWLFVLSLVVPLPMSMVFNKQLLNTNVYVIIAIYFSIFFFLLYLNSLVDKMRD